MTPAPNDGGRPGPVPPAGAGSPPLPGCADLTRAAGTQGIDDLDPRVEEVPRAHDRALRAADVEAGIIVPGDLDAPPHSGSSSSPFLAIDDAGRRAALHPDHGPVNFDNL